jgi:hypothetical protein
MRTAILPILKGIYALGRTTIVNRVSLWCVNDWCKRDDLTPQVPKIRKRKLDWEALSRHIQEFPDALLRELCLTHKSIN